MDARDVAEAAATRASAPFLAKAGCIGAALALVGMLGLGATTLIAGAAKKASDAKNSGSGCAAPGLPDPTSIDTVPSGILAQQIHHAKIIDDVAQERGLPGRASLIAFMTALQESGLQNLNHGDRDSLGLFQQRPSQGWGTPAEITSPPRSAQLFFGGNTGRPPGLVDISAWQIMDPGRAAQRVQRSGHPELYATRRGQAEEVARKAGISLDRLGTATGERPEWAQPSDPDMPPDECNPEGSVPGAPFHDAEAGWPPEVKNPRSTQAAIAWARDQPAKRQGIWWRRCLAFASIVHGWNVSGVESAAIHYQQMPAHMKHDGSRDVPPGALMYWDTGIEWGHVAVYLGNGEVISNDIRRPGYLDIVPASLIESKWGAKYLGWAPPYFPKGS
ncbi:peptidase M23 [Streptomyces sp. Isolate_45]|uniref:peptidase M23 n=1 Tax=Streptomyces sp. Isolate_45 TaxID=2950111 RepID=UPI002481B135|nr:peptidase M23 [Streptomyces sp. Isolate_45]MDA5284758.1 peptidase M23 [Streptomyces sp. Isolate_45]